MNGRNAESAGCRVEGVGNGSASMKGERRDGVELCKDLNRPCQSSDGYLNGSW